MQQIKRSILTEQLERMKRESEERVTEGRAKKFNLPYMKLDTIPVQIDALGMVGESEAKKAKLAVIQKKETSEGVKISLVVFDPSYPETGAVIRNLEGLGFVINIFVGSLAGLIRIWGFYQFVTKDKKSITGRVGVGGNKEKSLEDLLNFWRGKI